MLAFLLTLVTVMPVAGESGKIDLAAQWVLTGDLAMKGGHYSDAITAYTTALRYNPGLARTWLMRGYAYQRSGDMANADSDYATALSIDPSLAGAVENYKELTAHLADTGYLSGTLLKGSSTYGWKTLTVDNTQGSHDAIVALAPAGTIDATIAVYVKRGYQHSYSSSVPDGVYDLYIEYGTTFNTTSRSFDNAICEKYTQQVDFSGLRSYSVNLLSAALSPSWLIPSLQMIPKDAFPKY